MALRRAILMKADPVVSLHAHRLFSGRACSCKKSPSSWCAYSPSKNNKQINTSNNDKNINIMIITNSFFKYWSCWFWCIATLEFCKEIAGFETPHKTCAFCTLSCVSGLSRLSNPRIAQSYEYSDNNSVTSSDDGESSSETTEYCASESAKKRKKRKRVESLSDSSSEIICRRQFSRN